MTAREILKAARAKIATPDKWCQKAPCEDERGRMCDYDVAARFCSFGALDSVVTQNELFGTPTKRAADDALNAAAREIAGFGYISLNDSPTTTHEDVLKMFDRAIELVSQ